MDHPPWLHVMQVEYDALLYNNTWSLTSRANLVGASGPSNENILLMALFRDTGHI